MRQHLNNCEIHRLTDRHLALFRTIKDRASQDWPGHIRTGQDRGLKDLGTKDFRNLGILIFRDLGIYGFRDLGI